MRRPAGDWVLGAAAALFTVTVILLWQGLVEFGWVNRVFVASPLDAFGSMARRAADGELLRSVASTTYRMVSGWLLASIMGIVIGALVGSSRLAHRLLMPTLEAFRPLPASAAIPVAMLIFGLTDAMSIAVVAFGALWPVLLSTAHGFRNVPRELREVGSILDMGRLRFFRTIALPSASIDIMSGLRISLALSLILAVVTEMQASLGGVGYDIFIAQRTFRAADLYAGLIVVGLIGLTINQILLSAEKRLFAWTQA